MRQGSQGKVFLFIQKNKGKYFPNGDFMTAKNKTHSSHTWRATLAGRRALQMGLVIKIIGDGTNTNIWTDQRGSRMALVSNQFAERREQLAKTLHRGMGTLSQ